MAVVPLDEDVSEAERQGRAPIDFAPAAAAVAAICALARGVLAGSAAPREDRVAD